MGKGVGLEHFCTTLHRAPGFQTPEAEEVLQAPFIQFSVENSTLNRKNEVYKAFLFKRRPFETPTKYFLMLLNPLCLSLSEIEWSTLSGLVVHQDLLSLG